MRAANARQAREAMRAGTVLRAATFVNRKKQASKKACRGKVAWS